jgi:hypothetical protein
MHNLGRGDTILDKFYKLNYQCNSCHQQLVGFHNYSAFYLVFASERFKDIFSILASAGISRATD